MRPQIPEKVEEQIEAVYEEAGYATKAEFVRDAIRRRLEELETDKIGDVPIEGKHFKYTFNPHGGLYKIKLRTTDESPLWISQNPIFYYGQERIDQGPIQSALEDISGVNNTNFITDGSLGIYLEKPLERPASNVVREVFETLYEAINNETDGQFLVDSEDELREALDGFAEYEG